MGFGLHYANPVSGWRVRLNDPSTDRDSPVDAANWGATPSALDELTSASSWEAANKRAAHGSTGTMSGHDLLMGSSFNLTPTDGRGNAGPWRVWAQGASEEFQGPTDDDGNFNVDGDVTTGYLGMDFRAGANARLGLAMARSDGEIDYNDTTANGVGAGVLDTELTSVLPYFHWTPREGLGIWGMLGSGTGEAELLDADDVLTEIDVSMKMIGLGMRGVLNDARQGGGELAWKASAFSVELESDRDENTGLTLVDAVSHRLRVAMEGRVSKEVSPGGGRLTSSWEMGLRVDDGDAEADDTNAGVDVGFGLHYANPVSGWRVRLRGRYLAVNTEKDFDDWNASLNMRYDPGVQGRGVAFMLEPTWDRRGVGNRIGIDFSNALGWWSKRGLRLRLVGEQIGGDGGIRLVGSLDF